MQKLYFLSDPPHLVKDFQNNWENSHGHLNTRKHVLSNEIVISSCNKVILYRVLSAKIEIIVFYILKLLLPKENKQANKKQMISSAMICFVLGIHN